MSIASLTYLPPIRRDAARPTLDYQLLDTAAEHYGEGRFLEAVQTTFAHLFPGDAPDLTAPFSFTQGSSRVTARIEDGVCFVSVPMVRLPAGGGGVAALRYVLTRINGSGQLHQARLRGEDILIEFSEKLSALHPQKLVEVLRRMPVVADQHDDWMTSQFGVTALDRGTMVPLDGGELERAEHAFATHWSDVDELLKEAQRKRSMFFLNEVAAFALHRLRFTLPLAGSVLPRLLEAANVFNDSDVDARKRETTLGKCVKDMKAVAGDELRASLGHVDHAISPHSEGTPERLTTFFGPVHYMQTIEKYRSGGQSLEAALALIGSYYYLLATHAWPAAVADELKAGLLASSGKPWRDAASGLFDHARGLVEQFCGDQEEAS